MMVDKDQDLCLGLNLSLNLMSPSFPFSTTIHHKSAWNHHPIPSSSSADQRTLRGIDVNRSLSLDREHSEEEAATSSPNSTVSSASGAKRGGRERERDLQVSDEEDGDGSRKKLRLSKEQSLVLEESFKEHSTLNPKQKLALAKQLNLRPRQVEVWFQNRRARTKLKQTEVECELLKRCCENLKEENRRLQKEVQELRALKLSPQLYMHMTPPTTLTMCPSCERLTSSNSSSAAVATSAQQQQQQQQRPWAPIPMRPNPFVSGGGAAAQRS